MLHIYIFFVLFFYFGCHYKALTMAISLSTKASLQTENASPLWDNFFIVRSLSAKAKWLTLGTISLRCLFTMARSFSTRENVCNPNTLRLKRLNCWGNSSSYTPTSNDLSVKKKAKGQNKNYKKQKLKQTKSLCCLLSNPYLMSLVWSMIGDLRISFYLEAFWIFTSVGWKNFRVPHNQLVGKLTKGG